MSKDTKLTPQHQELVDELLKNLEKGTGLWKQGWVNSSAPVSFHSNKRYRGINNLFLAINAANRGYKDNRWLTYKQIEENGWKFKRDANGNSLGKDAGVTVEYYALIDKTTNQPLDRSIFVGLTEDQIDAYCKENVVPVRKDYKVFNADIVEGIPAKEEKEQVVNVKEAEELLDYWSNNEAKIFHDSNEAYYDLKTDTIHVPNKDDFVSTYEYYLTIMHEMAHSTGHKSRMAREMGRVTVEKYAMEELKAEIASMFLGQEYNVPFSSKGIKNNAAYIQDWISLIKNQPKLIFTTIKEADDISRFVVDKKKIHDASKKPFYYSEESFTSKEGKEYKTYFYVTDLGKVDFLNRYPYPKEEQGKLEELLNAKKEQINKTGKIEKVSFEDLQVKAKEKKEEVKALFIKPSEIVKRACSENVVKNRGIETLKRAEDLEIIEKVLSTRNGDKFKRLYAGEDLYGSKEKNDRCLMGRIACYTEDNNQMVRLFKSSFLYDASYKDSYYLAIANKAKSVIQSTKRIENIKEKELEDEKEYTRTKAKAN